MAAGDPSRVGTCFIVLPALVFFLVILFYPISLLFVFKVVKDYERAVLLRRGYIISRRLRGPGLFHRLPCTDEARVVDIRTATLELQQVEATTKDGIGARLDVVVNYHISDPISNVLRVGNTSQSLSSLARDTLKTVMEDLKQKDLFGQSPIGGLVLNQMAETAEKWGVTVERVEIKEVVLKSEAQMPEMNERETIHRTLAKLQQSCKENGYTCSQTLQQSSAILEETRATLKLNHEQASQDLKDSPDMTKKPANPTDTLSNKTKEPANPTDKLSNKTKEPANPTDTLSKELLIKLYETLYASPH